MNAFQHFLHVIGVRGEHAFPPGGLHRAHAGHPRDTPSAPHESAACTAACAEAQEVIARLQRENEQLRADSQARSQWFASAIHDLRQPLQALMLFSEALAETSPAWVQRQQVARVRQSVASLDRLCAGMLDLVQIEAGQRAGSTGPVALAPVFDELRHTFGAVARAQGLRLVVRPTGLGVNGDALMLTRILNNLVCNALRNTARGGVLIGARRRGGEVCIDVCDTGSGISDEHQSHVFQPFYQVPAGVACDAAESRGHGLGLSTVRHLAQLLGARVELRSRRGRGTTVSVHLALACAIQG